MMKYARIERERRYLLAELPPGLTADSPHTHIIDRYIPGTRLRLRRMEDETGNVIALKLTQKYDPPTGTGLETIITNLYLNETEFQALACLEGPTLRKRRYPYPFAGRNFSIDVFEGALKGLILCEIEFDEHTDSHLELPPFAVREVTDDPFFTGGHLVTLTRY
jgi:CYTH domain-containing protein